MVCDREAGERGRPSGEQEERRWGSVEIGGSVCCLQRDGVMGKLGGGGGGGKRRGGKRSKYIQVAHSTVLRLLRPQHRCMETFHKCIHMYSMYVFLYIQYILYNVIQYILHTEYVHTYICTAPISNTLHIRMYVYIRIYAHM